MTKREKLARAVWTAKGERWERWLEVHEGYRDEVYEIVDAFLAELREPDERMVNAGGIGVWDSSPGDFHDLSREACRSAAIPCLRAMLDAIE